jgi:shikimate 5-dehydrogenase
MAAEYAIVKLISNDAGLSAILGSGTASRAVVGQLPQKMILPALNIIRHNTKPSDTKDGVSRLDEQTISITVRDLSYSTIVNMSEKVRTLIDGLKESSVVINSTALGTRTVEMEHCWFFDESYDVYEHEDRQIEVYEQTYKVRVKR